MSSCSKKIKIAVFGDSISEGIGSRRLNYCKPLEEKLKVAGIHAEIINFSYTGTTIRYVETIKSKFEKEKFDFIVIAYGNVDAMLRPDTNNKFNLYSHLPSRYKKTGMLNPRPYFSNNFFKSIIQHIDSWTRWNINRILLKLQGETVWVVPDEFENAYRETLLLLSHCADQIIMLSTVRVSDKYFPGTNGMYCSYNSIIKKLSETYNCCFIDLYNSLSEKKFYYKDIFHPNESGYRLIADLISHQIVNVQNEKNA